MNWFEQSAQSVFMCIFLGRRSPAFLKISKEFVTPPKWKKTLVIKKPSV